MFSENRLYIAKGSAPVYLVPNMANRHGLIAGATGTGKTITLKVMAESLSAAGVPVFLADIKGDLSGMCMAGQSNAKLEERLSALGISGFGYTGFPTRFFDVFGAGGHPVRTTISEMGPMLLSRLLGLTDVQSGVMNLVFRIADDKGLLLIDLKDLRAMLRYIGENNADFTTEYGNASKQSVGAILRALLALEDAGGTFFGEPALDAEDWIKTDEDGRGFINILDCRKLAHEPLLYSTFMLWLLSELFERLPEVGDPEKPKIAFFFDEAHLLFNDAPKALITKIEQVVKLIRSKGVGVYFITQSPSDIPDTVLAQLGNRVQHALRAYTPAEQKAVRAAADAFRPNPAFDTKDAIMDLGTGEALVSFLDEKGRPGMVERATVLPPQSKMGMIDEERRKNEIEADALFGKYENEIDRESAYEVLNAKEAAGDEVTAVEASPKSTAEANGPTEEEYAKMDRYERIKADKARAEQLKRPAAADTRSSKNSTAKKSTSTKKKSSTISKATNSAMNSMGREIGKQLSRGLLGLLKR